jgi:hypothetical protein
MLRKRAGDKIAPFESTVILGISLVDTCTSIVPEHQVL